MNLKIINNEELDQWMNERRQLGHDLWSVKGKPPVGAIYDDGEPITSMVNVAWRDGSTGEIFPIEYDSNIN